MIIAVDPESLKKAGTHITTLSTELNSRNNATFNASLSLAGAPSEGTPFFFNAVGLASDVTKTVRRLANALTATGATTIATAWMYENVEGGVSSAFTSAASAAGNATDPDVQQSPPSYPPGTPIVSPG